MPRIFLLLLALSLISLSNADTVEPAMIEFRAETDMKKWNDRVVELRWGIAISDADITTVVVDGWSYNEPSLNLNDYDDYIVKGDIESFKTIRFKVTAGVYDWLILLDENANGSWDAYLGSAEEHIQLNRMEFKSGYTYSVVVGEDSIPRLTVRPGM